MKRLISAVVTFTLLFCMTACVNTNHQATDVSQSESGVSENGNSNSATDVKPSDSVSDTAGNQTESVSSKTKESTEEISEMKMTVQIGTATFTATLEDNIAAREFIEMMKEAPVSIEMSDYSGFEKVGSLGRSLTADNHQTTTNAGDIVLYNGSNIVMFYGSNSWSYTRIGHIDNLTGWEDALGNGIITAVFTVAE